MCNPLLRGFRQNPEDPSRQFHPAVDPQEPVDVLGVVMHRMRRDAQPIRGRLLRHSLRQQQHHFRLPGRKTEAAKTLHGTRCGNH